MKIKIMELLKLTIAVIRTVILYITIMLALRLMGKRQISQLQPSELVVTLLISDIASIPMQNTSFSLLSGLIPMVILVSCEIIMSVLMVKSGRFRRIVCGRPLIVIENGIINQTEMKRLRMTIEDLSEQLRQMDVFDFSEVDFAIVETNGKLSVLKKAGSQLPSAKDLSVKIEDKGMDTVVISDGEFSDDSMKFCKVTKEYIMNILLKQKVKPEDIFIMTFNKKKNYKIIKKEKA